MQKKIITILSIALIALIALVPLIGTALSNNNQPDLSAALFSSPSTDPVEIESVSPSTPIPTPTPTIELPDPIVVDDPSASSSVDSSADPIETQAPVSPSPNASTKPSTSPKPSTPAPSQKEEKVDLSDIDPAMFFQNPENFSRKIDVNTAKAIFDKLNSISDISRHYRPDSQWNKLIKSLVKSEYILSLTPIGFTVKSEEHITFNGIPCINGGVFIIAEYVDMDKSIKMELRYYNPGTGRYAAGDDLIAEKTLSKNYNFFETNKNLLGDYYQKLIDDFKKNSITLKELEEMMKAGTMAPLLSTKTSGGTSYREAGHSIFIEFFPCYEKYKNMNSWVIIREDYVNKTISYMFYEGPYVTVDIMTNLDLYTNHAPLSPTADPSAICFSCLNNDGLCPHSR